MILKISRELDWRFIDKIEDAFVSHDSGDNIAQCNDCMTEWLDYDKNQPIDQVKIYKTITLSKNGELFKRIVIGKHIVYLLNDEGKTVERLN